MAKKIGKPKIVIWTIVTAICALLPATAIVGTYLANFHASALNNLFGCQTYKIVDNDTETDSEYFKSAYVDENGEYDDETLWAADVIVAKRVQSEGTTLLWNNDGALPLDEGSYVSLFGRASAEFRYSGVSSGGCMGSGSARSMNSVLGDAGFGCNVDLYSFYRSAAPGNEKRSG